MTKQNANLSDPTASASTAAGPAAAVSDAEVDDGWSYGDPLVPGSGDDALVHQSAVRPADQPPAWPAVGHGTQTGFELGQSLTELYQRWRADGGRPSLQLLASAHIARLGIRQTDDPLVQAAGRVGEAVQQSMQDHAYHNADHVAEVLNNAAVLCEINQTRGAVALSRHDCLLIFVAALGHDFGHDGTTNQGEIFRLESLAAGATQTAMRNLLCDADDVADVETLILATDPGPPARFVKALARWAEGRTDDPPDLEGMPKELSRLVDNRRLAVMAGLLQDADLLSSAGLSIRYNENMSARIGEEQGSAPSPESTLYFIDNIVGGGFTTRAGGVFDGNMLAIRALAEERQRRNADGLATVVQQAASR